MAIRIIVVLVMVGCSPTTQPCYPENMDRNVVSFEVPDGGDSRGYELLGKVAECLKPLNSQWLSEEEARDAECLGPRKIELRSCAQINVVAQYHISPVSGEEVFECDIGPERCIEKGQTPTDTSKCMCRAAIQDDTVIWTTPNYKLAAAYSVTLLTGCLNPWTPTLIQCSGL